MNMFKVHIGPAKTLQSVFGSGLLLLSEDVLAQQC